MKKRKLIERAKEQIRERLSKPYRGAWHKRSLSLGTMDKDTDTLPGDRGACEQKSLSQGSE